MIGHFCTIHQVMAPVAVCPFTWAASSVILQCLAHGVGPNYVYQNCSIACTRSLRIAADMLHSLKPVAHPPGFEKVVQPALGMLLHSFLLHCLLKNWAADHSLWQYHSLTSCMHWQRASASCESKFAILKGIEFAYQLTALLYAPERTHK